jgi:hypothetical protein
MWAAVKPIRCRIHATAAYLGSTLTTGASCRLTAAGDGRPGQYRDVVRLWHESAENVSPAAETEAATLPLPDASTAPIVRWEASERE